MICWYQTMTEAMYSCLTSREVNECENTCYRYNADALYGAYDCIWAFYHSWAWDYGYCNYHSSLDADDSTVHCWTGDNIYTTDDTDFCDDYDAQDYNTNNDAAVTTAPPVFIVIAAVAVNALVSVFFPAGIGF
ncbi:unnamed protein product [Heterosigma akashiwo]